MILLLNKYEYVSVDELRRCNGCGRRLGVHLFLLKPDRCNACVKKQNNVNIFFPHSKSSINNTFLSREILAGTDAIDPIIYYRSVSGELSSFLDQGLQIHSATRWILRSTVIFERMVEDNLEETKFNFHSEPQTLLRADQIGEQVESAISSLLALILEMSERESDFVFKSVFSTTIELARYNPVAGSSYIRAPAKLEKKKAIINIQKNASAVFFLLLLQLFALIATN